jgi:hypothetical protein
MTHRFVRGVAGGLALLSLAASLAAPILFFQGLISEASYKTAFLVASVGWFVFAIARGFVCKPPAAREPMP